VKLLVKLARRLVGIAASSPRMADSADAKHLPGFNHVFIINAYFLIYLCNRFALESFGRGLQSLLVASSSGSVVLVSATLRESLDTQLDNLRLKLMHLLSQEGHRGRVMGAVVEVGLVLAGRGKKSDDFCVLAG